jgi:hypothetical protein
MLVRMSRPRTRAAAGVVAWVVAVSVALVVGLTAVGAIGSGLLGAAQQPMTPAQVTAALASTDPPAPVAPAPAAPSAAPAAAAPDVIATAGGTVLARCTAGVAEVVSATPAQGFRVQTEFEDGGPRVRFRAGHERYEVTVRCVAGRAVGDVSAE